MNPIFEDFSTASTKDAVNLNWLTHTNVTGTFELQRSAQKEESWTSVGSVPSDGLKSFNYSDASVSEDGKYSYRAKFTRGDGGYAFSNKSDAEILPVVFSLAQNYPNPFNPSTMIKYQLPNDSKVTITVFNTIGQKVIDLVNNEVKPAGTYYSQWNAGNYASGVYLLRIIATSSQTGENFSKVVKMMLLK